MIDEPLVSIVICIYNEEKYLSECIDSLLRQTYKKIEIVLVDDGSTDNSVYLVDQYVQLDSRVKAIHQKNLGFGGARNTGIDNSCGDFISFVDADDFVEPDYVSYLLSVQRTTQSDIAISKNCFMGNDTTQIPEDRIVSYDSQQMAAEFFYPRIRLGSWNKLYRRSFMERYSLRFMPQLTTGEGLQFITKAALLTPTIGVGQRKVYHHRLDNPSSATTKANVEKQGVGSLKTIQYIMKNLGTDSIAVKRAMNWHLWSCYGYCLRQLIDSGEEKQYSTLYKKCVDSLRKGSFAAFRAPVPLRNKIAAAGNAISPRIVAVVSLHQKRRRLKKRR